MSNRTHNDNQGEKHLRLALDQARELVNGESGALNRSELTEHWAAKAVHVGDFSVLALALRAA